MSSRKRILVVGGGPGGLTSAMILSHRGFDVQVYEKEKEVGGRNAALKLNGFTFDTGPTFLMMRFILEQMFKEAGRKAEDYLSFKSLDPFYTLDFNGKKLNISRDNQATAEEIRENFAEGSAGFRKFMQKEGIRYKKLYPCIQRDYSTFFKLLSPTLITAIPYLSIGRTVFSNLGRYFRDDKLKLAFSFQSKYLGMSPWECPAFFTMLSYIEHRYGIEHVVGGLNRISNAMAEVIEEEKGEIFRETPVESLWVENGKAEGVILRGGEKVKGDAVFLNSDFGYSMTRLIPDGTLKKYTPQKMDKMKFSCSTFMLYLGVKRKVPELNHHNIFFAENYTENINSIFHGKRLVNDFSFYIQNACVTDGSLAPDGKSTIYVLVPVPNQESGIDWNEQKDEFKDKIIKQIISRTDIKDIRDIIECEKVITPLNWQDDFSVYKGATFNLSHNISQLLYLRPRNRFEEIRNCYLVGGGTHPGSGLPTIYESARISSNLLCDDLKLPYKKPARIEA